MKFKLQQHNFSDSEVPTLAYFGLLVPQNNYHVIFSTPQPQFSQKTATKCGAREHQHKSAVGQKKREKRNARKKTWKKGTKKTLQESGDDGKKFRYSSSFVFVIKYILYKVIMNPSIRISLTTPRSPSLSGWPIPIQPIY